MFLSLYRRNVFTTLLTKRLKASAMSLCYKDAIVKTLQDIHLAISGLQTVQKCVHLFQVFPLNPIAFHFSFHVSVAMLEKAFV